MKDYCTFLIRRHTVPWFAKGATEVHLIFDNPNILAMSPKALERRHWDNAGGLPVHHQHREFGNTAIVPSERFHGPYSTNYMAIRNWFWRVVLMVMQKPKTGGFLLMTNSLFTSEQECQRSRHVNLVACSSKFRCKKKLCVHLIQMCTILVCNLYSPCHKIYMCS